MSPIADVIALVLIVLIFWKPILWATKAIYNRLGTIANDIREFVKNENKKEKK